MKLTIGEKISLLRKEKNITQTELAEYLSLAPQAISRWEVGDGAPNFYANTLYCGMNDPFRRPWNA